VQEYRDKSFKCIDCGEEFIFSAGEQLYFGYKGRTNDRKRCTPCTMKKHERVVSHSKGETKPERDYSKDVTERVIKDAAVHGRFSKRKIKAAVEAITRKQSIDAGE